MNRQLKIYGMVGEAVLLIAYVGILILLSKEITSTLVIVGVFCTVSVIVQFIVISFYFSMPSPEGYFYTAPIAVYGYIYVIVQYIIAVIAVVLTNHNVIISDKYLVIVELVISAIFIIIQCNLGIVTQRARKIKENYEDSVYCMKIFADEMWSIYVSAPDLTWKKRVKKVYEEIRYANPVSTPENIKIEQELDKEIRMIRKAVNENDVDCFSQSSKQITALLAMRRV